MYRARTYVLNEGCAQSIDFDQTFSAALRSSCVVYGAQSRSYGSSHTRSALLVRSRPNPMLNPSQSCRGRFRAFPPPPSAAAAPAAVMILTLRCASPQLRESRRTARVIIAISGAARDAPATHERAFGVGVKCLCVWVHIHE
jgi:hypothetical protein